MSLSVQEPYLHRQFTLLKLSRDFKRCDSFNRGCAGVKNGGSCFDCDGRILDLVHTKCARRILTTEGRDGLEDTEGVQMG